MLGGRSRELGRTCHGTKVVLGIGGHRHSVAHGVLRLHEEVQGKRGDDRAGTSSVQQPLLCRAESCSFPPHDPQPDPPPNPATPCTVPIVLAEQEDSHSGTCTRLATP